jgi:ribonuclease P protein component
MPVGRVQSRSSFAALRQHGRRARSGALRVIYLPAPDAGAPAVPRVAFSISRAVGGAVVRNRIRRRLRAACSELDPAPGTYLLTATPAAATCGYADLRADLARALAEVGATGEVGGGLS